VRAIDAPPRRGCRARSSLRQISGEIREQKMSQTQHSHSREIL
jgi:hypothetical protein